MSTSEQIRAAQLLLSGWSSDEDVERTTGVSLLDIIAIRAQAASGAYPKLIKRDVAACKAAIVRTRA